MFANRREMMMTIMTMMIVRKKEKDKMAS